MRRIIRSLWDWVLGRNPWLDEQHARLAEFKREHAHLYIEGVAMIDEWDGEHDNVYVVTYELNGEVKQKRVYAPNAAVAKRGTHLALQKVGIARMGEVRLSTAKGDNKHLRR